MQTFLLALGFFLLSIVLTGFVRRYVIAKKILDLPNNRSSHEIPTPRGGGASIVLLFTGVSFWLVKKGIISTPLFYTLSGGLLIAGIGWLDDIISIRPLWRALIQALVASWAVYWLGGLSGPFPVSVGYVLAVVSIIWCVNLYNFMDGIDGLAGTEGLFISLSAAIILGLAGSVGMSTLCFILAAIIAGFLVWNWPPAKIFMGDIGSSYLGYVFAVLAIATVNLKVVSLGFWLTISAVFLCDATFTLIKRVSEGKRWYEAHREHAYQQLIIAGATHKRVTCGVLLFNIFILFPVADCLFYYPEWTLRIVCVGGVVFFILWRNIVKNLGLTKA